MRWGDVPMWTVIRSATADVTSLIKSVPAQLQALGLLCDCVISHKTFRHAVLLLFAKDVCGQICSDSVSSESGERARPKFPSSCHRIAIYHALWRRYEQSVLCTSASCLKSCAGYGVPFLGAQNLVYRTISGSNILTIWDCFVIHLALGERRHKNWEQKTWTRLIGLKPNWPTRD